MRTAIIGAGPAGLFLGLLLKRRRPQDELLVFEQNPPGATFGFGVVFSDGALEFLRAGEPQIFKLLEPQMERWPEQKIVHRDEAVFVDGNGFSAIGRLQLMTTLERLCDLAGVRIVHGRKVETLAEVSGFDLVVGADGVNSMVRRSLEGRLRSQMRYLRNKFAWYGTTKTFECLTLTFRHNEHGHFVAHHYRYAPDMSTFIVECDAATWYRAGLDRMSDEESRVYCERVFVSDLDGHSLLSNRSIWRNFPLLWTRQWTADNVALIGDAVRTGHFSIGSGTRLAMEDSIALAAALDAHGEHVAEGLAEFERSRKPIAEKIVAAATASSYWYERISEKMTLAPWQLAYDYMTRSGRMPDERLRAQAPRFMAQVDRERLAQPQAAYPERKADPCGANTPGAKEIGWTVPQRYNAARILFDNLAAGRGSKKAVVCEDRTFTYAQIGELACRIGNGLAAMGLARGSRVLLVMLDTPEYVAAIFGAMRAGFVPVLVNTLSPAELVAYYLSDSGAEAAIVHDSLANLLEHPDVRASRLRDLVVVGDGAVPPLDLVEVTRWDTWTRGAAAELNEVETHPDEMAFWMYSSGSTGRPKGVVHLHHDAPYTYDSYG